jgi:bifunctional UDP-N-acetylglucosamine pyrophosphorylase/glucosamine-1-phosphate N-acetyltransferase
MALGRTILGWVLEAVGASLPHRTVVVVGHGAEVVTSHLPSGVDAAVQEEQLGSGHALASAMPALDGFVGDVLVVNGDGALFTAQTLSTVVQNHRDSGAAATALGITSAEDLPYGRVIRDSNGGIEKIVEAADASPQELAVRELNAGVYCFSAEFLRSALPRLSSANAAGEQYITDLIGIARADKLATCASVTGSPEELLGINTRADLAEAERLLRNRVVKDHQARGVTIHLPDTVMIEPTVVIEPDATIHAGSILRGETVVASEAEIGPYSVMRDTRVGRRAKVVQSNTDGARVGENVLVGPYAYLRPGADLREDSKAGAFVEIKQSVIGVGSKVPHLSYIGDATVGPGSNIGAGNITANYRPELGRGKQPTVIGAGVRTGSDNVFVAPVTIGDGAFTGAGSIIVQDVPAGALAIARARQVNLQDYAQGPIKEKPPRAGTS